VRNGSAYVPAEGAHLKPVFKSLWRSMTERYNLRTAAIILFSYLAFGIFIRSFNFHLIHNLHWPDQKLSVLQGSWASLITFAVLITGGVLADRVGHAKLQRKVLFFLAMFLVVFNALSPAWRHEAVAATGLLIWSVADPFYSVAAFPILMTLCRPAIAGSQFTAYMALINLSEIGGAYISGWLLHLLPAAVLGFGCGVLLLVCCYDLFRKAREPVPAAFATTQ
jgi:PAT family beta-lactamase induction signal transducer AmpG